MADGEAPWWSGLEPVGGVFEGGGAKGVAYAGALSALCRRGYWFEAVAGASAGALTATLVAAGMRPEKLQAVSLEGLARMDPAGQNGSRGKGRRLVGTLWNLSKHSYGLDEGPLRGWLLEELDEQLKLFGVSTGTRGPTFEQLQEATGIDLYVVGANASLQEQIVFHHETTPGCQVLDAVIASCAIPGAFRPGHLAVPAASGDLLLHTVVDGGVWANFPIYVLTDQQFRDHVGLKAQAPKPVLGFILDEPESEAVLSGDRYKQAEFAPYDHPFSLEPRWVRDRLDALARELPESAAQVEQLRWTMAEPAVPLEWRGELVHQHTPQFTQMRKLSLPEWQSLPREEVARVLEAEEPRFSERFQMSVLAGHNLRGFWPRPTGRLMSWLVRQADQQLGYLSNLRVALVVWLSVAVGWLALSYVALAWIWTKVVGNGYWELILVFAFLVVLAFLIAGAFVLFALAVLLVLNVVALATVRRIG